MNPLSFREKSILGSLLILLPTAGYYFYRLWQIANGAVVDAGAFAGLAVGTIVLVIALQIAVHIAIALTSREEPRDERDVLCEGRAARNAYYVLAVGAFLSIAHGVAGALVEPVQSMWFSPLATAHVTLLALLLAESTLMVSQLAYYRWGI